MLKKLSSLSIKKPFPLVVTSVLLILIFFSSPENWLSSYFLDHDYPFDYFNWKSLYINQSNARISTLALVSLLPNIIISQILGTSIAFLQSFVIKILPLIIFIYFFSQKIVDWYINNSNKWQDYLFILLAILLIFFGLTGQMFLNSGIFYSYIFQLNFYLFLIHLGTYLHNPNLIYQKKYIYLGAALIQTSIIIGSTFIPIIIYFFILFSGNIKKITKKENIILLLALICSALAIYYLSQFQNISIETGFDELNASERNRGYENISGGYFYQFIGYSNWGIYTGWPDRLIGGFSNYYNKPHYQLSLLMINCVAIYSLYKEKFYKLCSLIIIFLIFSVASQPPFGQIFIWLIDNVPGFESIRTPDNKFGFFTQAILIISLIKSWFQYSKILKKIILFSLLLVSIFNLYPVIKGKVVFGYNSQFSSNSTFIIDISYEKNLLTKLHKNDFILAIPGYGVFDHPSGRVGLIDPIYSIHEKVISYRTILDDPNSPYYKAIKNNNFFELKNVNVILYRKSQPQLINESELEMAGFNKIYEDNFVEIYKSNMSSGNLLFDSFWLWQILLISLILYIFLTYFLYMYSSIRDQKIFNDK